MNSLRSILTALLLLAIVAGCGTENSKPKTLTNDPFSGPWIGTWAVQSQVHWRGDSCPADSLMLTTVAIVEGDHITDLIEHLVPPDFAPYVHLMKPSMTLTGNDITFSCDLSTTIDGCFVSSTVTGTGHVDSDSFTITPDATFNQAGPACGSSPVPCPFDVVAMAQKATRAARPR